MDSNVTALDIIQDHINHNGIDGVTDDGINDVIDAVINDPNGGMDISIHGNSTITDHNRTNVSEPKSESILALPSAISTETKEVQTSPSVTTEIATQVIRGTNPGTKIPDV